jgi:FlaA1/EpsC-like NDP-sugar epimerase
MTMKSLSAPFPLNHVGHVGRTIQKVLRFLASHRGLRFLTITLWYVAVVSIAYMSAFLLRFDSSIPNDAYRIMLQTLPILLVFRIAAFKYFDLYSGLIHYVSVEDVWRSIQAVAVSSAGFLLVVFVFRPGFHGYPRSIFVIEMMISIGILCSHRMALRALRERSEKAFKRSECDCNEGNGSRRILLVGALNEADNLLRDVDFNGNGSGRILGIVNENPLFIGKKLRNAPILGVTNDLRDIVALNRPDEILILPPYTSPHALRGIVESCKIDDDYACNFKMVPSLFDIAEGKISVSMIRKVQIEDLLGRTPVNMDRTEVEAFVKGRSVMITGAGGSIGSELCRQIAHYRPSRIVLYERNEYNLYRIERNMLKAFPGLETVPVAGDVCDERKLGRVVQGYDVEIIYHAAAYKHVPLMEQNVSACMHTNVIGTECAARVAERFSVKKFVLISSDKAVRPTSIMGSSKRLAERVIRERPASSTKFVAVRFGNVLDSSGSVIPLFKQQIQEGGPLTVTHPEITRYFMSIPEAVDLVLQAAVVGKNREVMVLEMGEPIRIHDLALRLVELSGLRPGKDIRIEFSGLRPGEKLYEELLTRNDDVVRTEHDKIWVLCSANGNGSRTHEPLEPVDVLRLQMAIHEDSETKIKDLIRRWVPDCLIRDADSGPLPLPAESSPRDRTTANKAGFRSGEVKPRAAPPELAC